MKAFHNKPSIKAKYLKRVRAHAIMDEIVQGKYWENGKGCAVGCTIHSSDHRAYEKELGIPEWLAHVEDTIFEGLPLKEAKKWPISFLSAIKSGAHLEKVKRPFLIFVLKSTLDKFDHTKYPDAKKAIDTVIDLYETGETDVKKFKAAEAVADAAAYAAAYAAAWAAAWSAANAAANRAAEAAANTAHAAAYAAGQAADAADAAAYATHAAAYAAAYTAGDKERTAQYEKIANYLLKLLRKCK